jgi:hypothetical protein
MSLLDRVEYEKNKLLARGDTNKLIELNKKSMEAKEKRMIDKQVEKEHQYKLNLEREKARKEYQIAEAREREKINYESRIARAKKKANEPTFLDRITKKVEQPVSLGVRKKLKRVKKPKKDYSKFSLGTKWFK